jgi:hypothetical protein
VLTALRDGSTAACRDAILAGTGGLKAAFFGYFLCRGKESNCRPAQGQRPRREGATRMPAKKLKNPNASAAKTKTQNPKTRMATASQTKTSYTRKIWKAPQPSPRSANSLLSPG